LAEIRARMAELEDTLPGAMIGSLQDQLQRIDGLEHDIDQLEQRMGTWQKQSARWVSPRHWNGIRLMRLRTSLTSAHGGKRSILLDCSRSAGASPARDVFDGNRVNVVELELCEPVRPILQVLSFAHTGLVNSIR
jgi:hypothetical protein